MKFHRNILQIDPEQEAERICEHIREVVLGRFKRRGVVIGVSGGVDSATVLALAVRALGAERVRCLTMPEQDSSGNSEPIARRLTEQFDVPLYKEDLTATLSAAGCYERRDAAVSQVFPEYNPRLHGMKLTLPTDLLDRASLNVYSLVLVDELGRETSKLLPPHLYWQIVAASNFKQRTRMMTLYFHAEQMNYAVIGTANKNEHAQGFFVKYGDGGVDLQPIQHLYKTQVYQLASYLGVPQEIIDRTPTSDTYSAESTQEEFYFRIPFEVMDLIWHGHEMGADSADVAAALDLRPEQVENVYADLAQKARSTEYLRAVPTMLTPPQNVALAGQN